VNPSLENSKKAIWTLQLPEQVRQSLWSKANRKKIGRDFVAALMFAHEKIKVLNQLQIQLAEQLEITKREYTIEEIPEEIVKTIEEALFDEINQYVHSQSSKSERREKRNEIYEKALALVTEKFGENEELQPQLERYTGNIVSDIEKKLMRRMIVEENRRLDGRSTTDIRPISCEVGACLVHMVLRYSLAAKLKAYRLLRWAQTRDEQLIEGLETFARNVLCFIIISAI
jgi:polyribonucleotide nucleotidyltransferase